MKIRIISGSDKGREFEVSTDRPLVIGRGTTSDTQLDDPTVSREHCKISLVNDYLILEDLKSSHGTFVAGSKIEKTRLAPGATFQVGNTVLKLPGTDMDDTTMMGFPDDQPAPVQDLQSLVGESFENYKIESLAKSISSGAVFKARDSEKDRDVALKVYAAPVSGNDENRQRFLRGMKAAISLRHENIVSIYEAGITRSMRWVAMEWIEGDDVAGIIKKSGIDGMLDWKTVWRIGFDVTRALQAAAEKGILHRNVTPTNILRQNSDGKILLNDFSIAKPSDGPLRDVSMAGQLVGELAFMAPERTLSDGNVDTRSDIYGLGATLYALLTGKPPAKGNSMGEILENIRDETPETPKSIQLSTDELFSDLVMRMIAKKVDDRPQNPNELAAEFQRIAKLRNLSTD